MQNQIQIVNLYKVILIDFWHYNNKITLIQKQKSTTNILLILNTTII